jgi:8-oxo-dGTP pyrophosphatase MutT (NUDIX family)
VIAVKSAFDMQSLRRRLLPLNTDLTSGGDHRSEAAVAVIIDPSQDGGSMLLIRRTERDGDPWSGQVAFPGGHKAQGDRTFLDTAIREAKEEVGISLHQHEILGVLPWVNAHTRRMRVAPFVFELKAGVQIQHNMEVEETFWVALSEIANSLIIKSEVEMERGKLVTDSYVYRGKVIWGLTFRIINILLNKGNTPTSTV